jgi:tetratricopeptide (TPR) repeat protein
MKKYQPEQMADLLIESDIQYQLKSDKQVKPLDLSAKSDTLSPVNVYLKTLSSAGFPIVMEENPTSLLKNMFEQAQKALQKKNYWKAAEIYQAAVRADRKYFKAYTYLGYCYLKLKKTDRAVTNLSQALKINPIDFQAHLYMAEVYEQKGNLEKAEETIAHAYMLARYDPEVGQTLSRILKKRKKVLKSGLMLIPGNYLRHGDTLTVYLKERDMASWSMLLQTLAAWDNEFLFKPHNQEGNLEKYKHALLNHALFILSQLRKKKAISEQARLLSDLIYDKKMLDPIVCWEIGAGLKSQLIQRLPEKIKQDIVTYIRQYVFTPQK